MVAKRVETKVVDGEIRFIHLRMHDDGSLLPNGGATIAYVRNDNHVAYAVAKCNMKDLFNRRLGRVISVNRLKQGHADYLEVDTKATRGQVSAALCSELYDRMEQHLPDAQMYLYPRYHLVSKG